MGTRGLVLSFICLEGAPYSNFSKGVVCKLRLSEGLWRLFGYIVGFSGLRHTGPPSEISPSEMVSFGLQGLTVFKLDMVRLETFAGNGAVLGVSPQEEMLRGSLDSQTAGPTTQATPLPGRVPGNSERHV